MQAAAFSHRRILIDLFLFHRLTRGGSFHLRTFREHIAAPFDRGVDPAAHSPVHKLANNHIDDAVDHLTSSRAFGASFEHIVLPFARRAVVIVVGLRLRRAVETDGHAVVEKAGGLQLFHAGQVSGAF